MRIGIITIIGTMVLVLVLAHPGITSASTIQSPKAAQAGESASAYTGTAEVRYTSLPRFDLPTTAADYSANHQAMVRFAVRDRSHFRADVQFINPAIDNGTLTVVVNGSTSTSYDARSRLAFAAKVPRQRRAAYLDELLQMLLSGAEEPGALPPQPDPTKPVSAYLVLLRHPPLAPPVRFRARIVGDDTLLGRAVDIIDYRPITVKVVGDTCTSSHGMTTCRPSRFRGLGSARIWIDHEHPFILRYQGHGTNDVHDVGSMDASLSYRLTSIAYGQGPSDADLQFQPPVKVVHDQFLFSFMPRGSDSGPGPGVAPPGPFVYPSPPSAGNLTTSDGIERLGYGPHYKIAVVTALFSTGKYGTTYFDKQAKLGPMRYVKGPYLLIQERLRVDGLPVELQTGTPQMAGSCQVWAGTYADGQRWLAFAKGNASVLISTNALAASELLRYVAQAMCS